MGPETQGKKVETIISPHVGEPGVQSRPVSKTGKFGSFYTGNFNCSETVSCDAWFSGIRRDFRFLTFALCF